MRNKAENFSWLIICLPKSDLIHCPRNIRNYQSFDAFRGNTMYYLVYDTSCFPHHYPPKHSFRNYIYIPRHVCLLDGNPLRIEHNSILHTRECIVRTYHCSTVRIICISIMTYTRVYKISRLVRIAIE